MRRDGRLFAGREGGVRQGAMWGIRVMEREARQDFDDGGGMVVVELGFWYCDWCCRYYLGRGWTGRRHVLSDIPNHVEKVAKCYGTVCAP